jgi:hypothetical protein
MTSKITQALHAVMAKVGYVQKSGKNQFHGYKYAGEADLLEKLRPAMVEAGLLLLPSGKTVTGPDEHGNVTVELAYTLAHKDGEVWPEKLVAFGCGNDRAKNGNVGDKGVYKAITGANKYLLFKLFQIETGDDPEHDHIDDRPPPAKKTSVQELNADVEKLGLDQPKKRVDPVAEDKIIETMMIALGNSVDRQDLEDWYAHHKATIGDLSHEGQDRVRKAYARTLASLRATA